MTQSKHVLFEVFNPLFQPQTKSVDTYQTKIQFKKAKKQNI